MKKNIKFIYHTPVLVKQILEKFVNNPDGIYVDATFGGGGHSYNLLQILSQKGKIIGLDQDKEVINNHIIKDTRIELFHKNFRYIENVLNLKKISSVYGILADLGVSSYQLDTPERGFSIRFNHLLDMRMDQNSKKSAKKIINTYSEKKLIKIFFEYGELKNSRKIAKKIIEKRKKKEIHTTFELKNILKQEIPTKKKRKFLAQLFQALRIEVNDELSSLKELLKSSLKIINKGGRIAIISYHSLEDRIVKQFFKNGCFNQNSEKDLYGNTYLPFKQLSKKVIMPDNIEILKNPRSKNARLRIAEKI